ncbi:uncharacterized protein LODBEIA_P41840 [Lodderomyces beijingensis]|uniref:CCZ1/INTU/HSP4 first Longin domain-containing protein n=1 Tax=Lodderomyces beijingensis TaxID=1775926 RepID=A0ABP0ZUW7_9ASCO
MAIFSTHDGGDNQGGGGEDAAGNNAPARSNDAEEELNRSILMFISCLEKEKEEREGEGDADADEDEEDEANSSGNNTGAKMRMVGLMRGVKAFAQQFQQTIRGASGDNAIKNPDASLVIKATTGSFLVLELEKNYHLVCCISSTDEIVMKQLESLIRQRYSAFSLSNKSIPVLTKDIGAQAVGDTLGKFWLHFMASYNRANVKVEGMKWPNYLNPGGALTLLAESGNIKLLHKKSSFGLQPRLQDEFLKMLKNENTVPQGIIVNCIDRSNSKSLGLIFARLVTDCKLREESLIGLSNYIEEEVMSGGSTDPRDESASLHESPSSPLLAPPPPPPSSALPQPGQAQDLSLYNPLRYTDTLMSPLYSVSNIMRLKNVYDPSNSAPERESEVNGNHVQEQQEAGGRWFSIPAVFSNKLASQPQGQLQHGPSEVNGLLNNVDANTDATEEGHDEAQHDVSEEEEAEEPASSGIFIFGNRANDTTTKRKIIYLPLQESEEEEKEQGEAFCECELISYSHDGIVVTLIYQTSQTAPETETGEFYDQLAESILEPLIEEIHGEVNNGSVFSRNLASSMGSLRTLNIPYESVSRVDNDFFYAIYDLRDNSYRSSLPQLPLVKPNNESIYHIHDQLVKILTPVFKSRNEASAVNEYFHKFTTSYKNDWMVYYIKYGHKLILVIKNKSKNKNSSIKNKNKALNGTSGAELNIDKGLLDQMTGAFSEYANLGFLDNLGDDVKYWLGLVAEDAET